MKAKEIAEQYYNHMTGMYVFDDEDLQEYANALCKEQRRLCVRGWVNTPDDRIREYKSILTAPQPEAK